jgi:hypothetical protein
MAVTVVTDENGSSRFENLTVGRYSIQGRGEGFTLWSRKLRCERERSPGWRCG